MKKVVIFGGTGFIGMSLAAHLSKLGFHPVLVARHTPIKTEFDFVKWDGFQLGEWTQALNGALAIVNLAGRTVDCIKSPDNCDVILRSRVDSTIIIGKALQEIDNPPKIWIQMSTAHIYGDPPSQLCTETSATGYGLAPFVGKAWEKAFL
ncbi:MAG: NAD-dependent epimerase/dehydratase family protein, partial [Crocinitomicaceae bacterium]|nr:NAD-dependent epimerase/dehydratase family protein [Crocinitomicaceae bacterium]